MSSLDLTNAANDFFNFEENLVEWGDVGTTYDNVLLEVADIKVVEKEGVNPYINVTLDAKGEHSGLRMWKKLFRHNRGSVQYAATFMRMLGLDPNDASLTLQDWVGCMMYASIEVKQNDEAYPPQPEIIKMNKASDIDPASLI